jgi:NifB/MoaA-like Fe-S oxidoreductase
MQLVAVTLVPTSADGWHSTPQILRDLLMNLREPADHIEHIQVIERSGLLWIGAYVSTPEVKVARRSLTELCGRLSSLVDGWAVIVAADD